MKKKLVKHLYMYNSTCVFERVNIGRVLLHIFFFFPSLFEYCGLNNCLFPPSLCLCVENN